ncbi:Amino acid transporter [Salinimicrobium sediminis]|uniref:Amino acid transporter n=1 Tax=Salinimicrobium sediminis TaxID=1343891 RepID=A0A285X8E3_9FLAO|nr:amino acid permease [Salinimicrobium sediminis]MDX1754045.1 amino acid permease [Salinimicrobium sediminis]SOC81617.1 Amino acid transporter [Salinimicrobium sediminis]
MNPDPSSSTTSRTIGFFGALGIGVGAMVGGGILALAGVAFAVSGPSAVLAFALNGLIAFITALSFAEMASANPQSGGTYTYAKKALSLQVAFGVGWIVWFASLVAAVLYALGFGAFALFALQQIPAEGLSGILEWELLPVLLALAAIGYFAFGLTRGTGDGGAVINVGKLAVFAVLIAGGLALFVQTPFERITESLDPFFSGGFGGLIAAMGYTFIALQGFDLIGSAAGEIKNPEKTIPKAMMGTLAVGLAIYLPLLFFMSTVGVPAGESITEMSLENPETVLAVAAQNYLGAFGFWLVLVAGIFSMLSALQANLFAASRISLSMAKDRTLNHHLSNISKKYGTPVTSILVTCGIVAFLVLILPDLAAAGAASSLIFLITFALAHLIMILMRNRGYKESKTFRAPFFPALPIAGIVTCLGLAIFQAIVVPAAGLIAVLWLAVGAVLFASFFIRKAEAIEASEQALDPDLIRLRGLSPLVMLPISNPANAQSMVFLANALAPPVIGRILIHNIVIPSTEKDDLDKRLLSSRDVMQYALKASFDAGLRPESLTTIADHPWEEIERVVKEHNCRSLLLGLSDLSDFQTSRNLEKLVRHIKADVVVFRQPFSGWKITAARKILIPVAGFESHDPLRARVAASLWRASQPEITFIQVLPSTVSSETVQKNNIKLSRFAGRIIPGKTGVLIIQNDDPVAELVAQASRHDLVIMGLGNPGKHQKAFGHVALALAEKTETALIFISKK